MAIYEQRPPMIDAEQWHEGGTVVGGVCREPCQSAPHVHTSNRAELLRDGDWICRWVTGDGETVGLLPFVMSDENFQRYYRPEISAHSHSAYALGPIGGEPLGGPVGGSREPIGHPHDPFFGSSKRPKRRTTI